MNTPDVDPDGFENTYPKHSFSELVRLSLRLAEWLNRRRSSGEKKTRADPLHPFSRHKQARSKFEPL